MRDDSPDRRFTPYQRLRRRLGGYRSWAPGRFLSIASGTLRHAAWRLAHPQASFADFYSGTIARRLRRGGSHGTLGTHERHARAPFARPPVFDSQTQRRRGREWFETLLRLGLEPGDVCVDYGCGSLRVGQHLIDYLDAGHYWGLDVTDQFYRCGLELLPSALIQGKQPRLRVISPAALREAAAAKPTLIVCASVLPHVAPDETGLFFDRILGLMGDRTRALISFRETLRPMRTSGTAWARDAATIERLIHERCPRASIDFDRELKSVSFMGVKQWRTLVRIAVDEPGARDRRAAAVEAQAHAP